MPRKFIFFINPISGTSQKKKLPEIIKQRCVKEGYSYEILISNAAGNYNYLKPKIEIDKITDIIICGGDGTISKITAALLDVEVSIGIIPMGSGNGLAFAAGIPANTDKAFEIIFKNEPQWTDGFFINEQFSCMLCGFGFDAVVAHGFAAQPGRGLITYLSESVKNLKHAITYNFTLKLKSTSITTKAFFISFANSNQFGNHVTIAPQASLCDGLIDVVIVQEMSKPKLVYSLLKQIFSGKLSAIKTQEKNSILYYQSSEIHLRNVDLAPMHIDGDPAPTAKEYLIRCQPRAFKLLQPGNV